ncbi:MAG: phosphate ABC transporter substrate-binding protein PstS [Syntrophobacteraceae bacterium]|jgi:phosphate transport system substrate-binding protein
MSTRKTLLSLAALIVALAGPSLSAQGQSTLKAPPGAILIKGAGATFPSLLYEQWFQKYHKLHPEVVVDYEPVGSGLGVERFIGVGLEEGKRVDFGASDAAMSDTEIAKVERGVRLIPMTAGGVVLAYNLPGLDGRLKLSRAAYTGIFLGRIKNWNDPVIRECNPGLHLPKLTIATAARSDGSGTTFAFTKHLDSVSPEWRNRYGAQTVVDWPGGPMRAKGNEGVATLIKHSEGSIGYVEFGFAQKLGLEAAALENKAGNYIVPTFDSAMAAMALAELPDNLRVFLPDPEGPESYPIVTLSWVLLYTNYADSKKAEVLRELFRWCLYEGQRFSGDLGYIPLPPNIVAKAAAALATISP